MRLSAIEDLPSPFTAASFSLLLRVDKPKTLVASEDNHVLSTKNISGKQNCYTIGGYKHVGCLNIQAREKIGGYSPCDVFPWPQYRYTHFWEKLLRLYIL